MAIAHVPYARTGRFTGSNAASPAAQPQRRRESRRPAGWLGVEAEVVGSGRRTLGRLLDTSAGGIGLVLSERLALGTTVRITPSDPGAGGAYWQGREARVVYAGELPGGSWRMGLAFTFARPSTVQMWGTRLVLLAAMLAAVASLQATHGESVIASSIVGTVVAILFAGSEWQHRSEVAAYERATANHEPPAA